MAFLSMMPHLYTPICFSTGVSCDRNTIFIQADVDQDQIYYANILLHVVPRDRDFFVLS